MSQLPLLQANALRRRTMAIFFVQSIVIANVAARMPDLQVQAGLGEAELGFVLAGAPLGAFAMFWLSSRIIARFGIRSTLQVSLPIMALSGGLVATVLDPLWMCAALFVQGMMGGLSNIAINVEADRVELATGQRVINRSHGIWSIGFLVSSLVAGTLRSLDVTPFIHLWTLVPIQLVLALTLLWAMPELPARIAHSEAPKKRFAPPSAGILALVIIGLGPQLFDGAARVWGTIFIRDIFDVPPLVESAALPAVVMAMAIGRLFADRLVSRLGPWRFALGALALSLVGVAIVAGAPNAYLALLGFAVAGLGSGVVYPLMISAAARLGDRPAAENVASVAMSVQLLMFAAPPAIGALAHHFGLRLTFAALVPIMLVALARIAMSRRL